MYLLNLANVNDEGLKELFTQLPPLCVVLLEDVDTAFDPKDQPDTFVISSPRTEDMPSRGKLSLSGLLNAFDGVAAHEGRILIMTTNHCEKLDAALTRPGRVDTQMHFGLCTTQTVGKIFRMMFKNTDCPCSAEDFSNKCYMLEELKVMSHGFENNVPENAVSQAAVVSFLSQYKDHPSDALTQVEDRLNSMDGGGDTAPK